MPIGAPKALLILSILVLLNPWRMEALWSQQ